MRKNFCRPLTAPGVLRSVGIPPSPSWPAPSVPQQNAVLSEASMAQVCAPPAEMASQVWPPATVAGVVTVPPVAALPTCPDAFAPQQAALPSNLSAQVWLSPAVMDDAP